MRLGSLGITLGMLVLVPAAHGQRQTSAKEEWLTDYEVAKRLARKTGKPLMVVFRCGP